MYGVLRKLKCQLDMSEFTFVSDREKHENELKLHEKLKTTFTNNVWVVHV